MKKHDMLVRLGKVLRRHREGQKATQEEFAAAINVNPSYYGGIERGNHNLTLLNLVHLSTALQKPLSQLIRDAEKFDLEEASKAPSVPLRRGRPPGTKSKWR
jgi:transcriptional regulator with XRE-family HTH domain